MKNRILLLITMVIFLGACAPAPYQKADLSFYAGCHGYLDQEIEPGIHIVEYYHIGGYNFDLELNKEYWTKRANELCPNGYEGGYKVEHLAHAFIEDCRCRARYCNSYPMVQGVIKCK